MRPATAIALLFALAPTPVCRAGGELDNGEQHWAYAPLRKVAAPAVDDLRWPRDLIDHHLLAAMEERGLRPVADADRRTLIRRASYDLTGLPPTPEEIEVFLADSEPGAFARVVDRLLASPAYGERWGRRWLDVVRYADTSGSSSDHPVPEARLYRDYVIDSFNKDKPFDLFVREQIAGDLMEHTDDAQRRERIIATGYLAGARRFGVSGKETHLTIEDTIANLGEAFLATSLGCARCHDHKHDAITGEDYYALYGIFQSTRYPFPGAENEKTPSDFVMLSGEPGKRAELERKIAKIEKELEQIKRRGREGELAEGERVRRVVLDVHRRLSKLRLRAFDDVAYAVVDAAKTGDAHLQELGQPGNKGPVVRRGFPRALGGSSLPDGHTGSGRLELAHWLTSPDNALFARVAVNRIWAGHFGRGLVATPNDFGTHGSPPSHPDLLDHLARQFIADGYSFKRMHRRLMLTRAYGLSSGHSETNAEKDPDADYRWRAERRRLSAEELRDSLLAVSGLLDRSRGGAHPFPPKEKWKYTQHGPFYATYNHDRRSVYLMQQRLREHPVLAVFDGADTNASTPDRADTTSPVQSLFLMNARLAHRAADGLAVRMVGAATDDAGRIRAAHRLAYGREAEAEEVELGLAFLERCRERLGPGGGDPLEAEATALSSYARVLLSANEFLYID